MKKAKRNNIFIFKKLKNISWIILIKIKISKINITYFRIKSLNSKSKFMKENFLIYYFEFYDIETFYIISNIKYK